jgi:hypothetical protein
MIERISATWTKKRGRSRRAGGCDELAAGDAVPKKRIGVWQ